MVMAMLQPLASGDPIVGLVIFAIWGIIAIFSKYQKWQQEQQLKQARQTMPPPMSTAAQPQVPQLQTPPVEMPQRRPAMALRSGDGRPIPAKARATSPSKPILPPTLLPQKPAAVARLAARAIALEQRNTDAYAHTDYDWKTDRISSTEESGRPTQVRSAVSSTELAVMLQLHNLRKQFILTEILRPPLAARNDDDRL